MRSQSDNGPKNTAPTGRIEVRGLSVAFANRDRILNAVTDLTVTVEPGEFLCLLGTTGCGKSTILNVLAGFIPPTSGEVLLDGKPIVGPGPDRGMVFQRHALFPWKTVRKNIEFGPRMKHIQPEFIQKRVESLISTVGLDGFEDRYPAELSGGMEQRVGLARMLANDPNVLLMDEPFGSLDAQTRMLMQELLLQIWDETDKTVVFVTHDVDEAILLADRIVVLTARPARLKAELPVNLSRPRDYSAVTSKDFVSLKQQALGLIREESLRAADIEIRE